MHLPTEGSMVAYRWIKDVRFHLTYLISKMYSQPASFPMLKDNYDNIWLLISAKILLNLVNNMMDCLTVMLYDDRWLYEHV